GEIETLLLPDRLTEALKTLCRQEDVTMHMLFLAVFETVLYRYTGQEDILIASPSSNRTQVELEPLIGLFSNPTFIPLDLSGGPTSRGLLGRVRETALGAMTHQDLPFERVIEALSADGQHPRSPVLQAYFIFQRAFMQPIELPDLSI